MDTLDKKISEALDDEDRKILERIGRDQSYSEQAIDLFRGKGSWMNWLLVFVQIVWFGVGIFAAWKCYVLTDVVEVVRSGLLATFFLLSAVIAKVSLLPALQANRVLRALKRLEMQVALLAAKR